MQFTGSAHAQRGVAFAAVVLLTLGSACVSSGKYEKSLAERQRIEQEKAKLQKDLQTLDQQRRELEQAEASLRGKLETREQEVARLRGTYDGLVAELKDEINSGQVQIEQLKNGIRLNVANEILFPSGSAELDTRGREVIDRVSHQIAATPNRIEVIGHTDDVPISAGLQKRYPSNWELAGGRAATVVRELQEGGVDAKRLRAVSLGQTSPIASNDTEDGRARNRRIEIRLLPALDTELAAEPQAGAVTPAKIAPAAP